MNGRMEYLEGWVPSIHPRTQEGQGFGDPETEVRNTSQRDISPGLPCFPVT